jgi:hypothetical protein
MGPDLRTILDSFGPDNVTFLVTRSGNKEIAKLKFYQSNFEIGELTYFESSIILEMMNGRFIFGRLKHDRIADALAKPD